MDVAQLLDGLGIAGTAAALDLDSGAARDLAGDELVIPPQCTLGGAELASGRPIR